ncbi:hypothetical protein CVT25_011493 [Psilocybe cyanescens]|uniref:Uncharacterized protein n=1 Tax=Psilocybe cyanescens TaxID=93625 RepID=A0A409XAF0_PSICY|nr:hypothetical protein CVT25_011493 [Psilocybe cyanescens]
MSLRHYFCSTNYSRDSEPTLDANYEYRKSRARRQISDLHRALQGFPALTALAPLLVVHLPLPPLQHAPHQIHPLLLRRFTTLAAPDPADPRVRLAARFEEAPCAPQGEGVDVDAGLPGACSGASAGVRVRGWGWGWG